MRLPFIALALLLPAVATAEEFPSLGPHGRFVDSTLIVSGRASFYSTAFHGRRTASGETYQHHVISAASNRFPLGALVAVRRVPSARCVVVRINDRMGHRKRVIDLSREAAVALGMIEAGVVDVEVARLPKYLVGHESACMLAFQPPAQLQALDGPGLRAPER